MKGTVSTVGVSVWLLGYLVSVWDIYDVTWNKYLYQQLFKFGHSLMFIRFLNILSSAEL